METIGDLKCIEILGATKCVCGNKKKRGMSHCRTCYFSLPPEIRKALYNRVGQGYEEAFTASVERLQKIHGMIYAI